MSTFWLKVAAVAIVAIGSFVLLLAFLPSGSKRATEPQPDSKTFYQVVEEDRAKYLTKPQPANSVREQPNVLERRPTAPETVTLYFSELPEIEKIEAERLLHVAVPGRSIGRLPMTGYNLMVTNCRQIIQRWPDSWYAYRAKQMLGDMPRRFWAPHHITEDEVDLSRFAEPRPGTQPFVVEIPK